MNESNLCDHTPWDFPPTPTVPIMLMQPFSEQVFHEEIRLRTVHAQKGEQPPTHTHTLLTPISKQHVAFHLHPPPPKHPDAFPLKRHNPHLCNTHGGGFEACLPLPSFGCLSNKPFPWCFLSASVIGFAAHWAYKLGFGSKI